MRVTPFGLKISVIVLSMLVSAVSLAFEDNNKRKEIDVVFGKLSALLPENSQLIALPYPENLIVYGDKASKALKADNTMIGGQVLAVKTKKSRNAYDAGVVLPISPAVKKGDVFYLTFFAKALSLPKNSKSVKLEGVGVQMNAEPYASIFANNVFLSDKMQSYAFAGKAQKDYAAGELQVTFQVATGKQEIGFGPVFLFAIDSSVDPSSLPYLSK